MPYDSGIQRSAEKPANRAMLTQPKGRDITRQRSYRSKHQFYQTSSLSAANFGGTDDGGYYGDKNRQSNVNSSSYNSSSSGGEGRTTMMQRRQQRLSGSMKNIPTAGVHLSQTVGGTSSLSAGASKSSFDRMASYTDLHRETDRIRESGKFLKSGKSEGSLPNLDDKQQSEREASGGPEIGRKGQPKYRRASSSKVGNTPIGSGVSAVRGLSGPAVDESASIRGIVGLQNLGNTCFMNSGLQCLFNTPSLASYFMEGLYKQHLCHKSPMKGQLAKSFAETFTAVQHAKPHSAVNPNQLKRLVGKWAPHLAGYAQQDSQEFVMSLLHGLSEDLNCKAERVKKPSDVSEDQLMKMTSEMQSRYWWNRHLADNGNFITDLFWGQLMSTVECCHCHCRSHCFDPFSMLSLPIPSRKVVSGSSGVKALGNSIRRGFGGSGAADFVGGGGAITGKEEGAQKIYVIIVIPLPLSLLFVLTTSALQSKIASGPSPAVKSSTVRTSRCAVPAKNGESL